LISLSSLDETQNSLLTTKRKKFAMNAKNQGNNLKAAARRIVERIKIHSHKAQFQRRKMEKNELVREFYNGELAARK